SEVRNQRNPLDPKDDKVREIGKIRVRPLNGMIMIDWSYPLSYTNMIGYISTDVNQLGNRIDLGQKGDFPITGLVNDTTYYVRLQGVNDQAVGDLSDPEAVTPKADPDMPTGALLIENGQAVAQSRQVVLNISATDQVLDGAAQGAAAHQTDMLSQIVNQVSGGVQMRISNSDDMSGAVWEPVTPTRNWTLDCAPGATCTVYAQFKDAAQNESLIVYDAIQLDADADAGFGLYLPVVTR
ncbi:MAG TPA: fibronectin type III domain-containing protein, partial [Alphaproteobacteria bacterium]|nr:fibronectin type III domain-containing protein [Alphaproteobacteria bacterium]